MNTNSNVRGCGESQKAYRVRRTAERKAEQSRRRGRLVHLSIMPDGVKGSGVTYRRK